MTADRNVLKYYQIAKVLKEQFNWVTIIRDKRKLKKPLFVMIINYTCFGFLMLDI